MNIDKSKLQPLLWAVVGAWKTGDQDLQVHTDALDEYLGKATVEEVALGLLAEIERLETVALAMNGAGAMELITERDQLKAENEALCQKADCVDDCAHLIRKLVHCRRQLAADDGLAGKALDFLKRKGLQGSPLRAEEVQV